MGFPPLFMYLLLSKIKNLISMKLQKLLFITIILILKVCFSNGQQLIKVWESQPRLQIPESVLYDSISGNIFVSNIQGAAQKKDGEGFISLLDNNGHIKNLKWVSGLNAPKGMAIFDGKTVCCRHR